MILNKEKPKCLAKILSQYYSVHHRMGLSAVLCSETPARRYESEALEGRRSFHYPSVEMQNNSSDRV
jgi:hypothetical protein